MQYVRTTSFLILINGVPNYPIVPNRGLRLGNPLFLYLLFLCAESLVTLLKQAMQNRSLMGISVCCGAPVINYLLFVDDSYIFCKASEVAPNNLLKILNEYAQA